MNPNSIWFISDLHLGHELMTKRREDGTQNRKYGYEERVLAAWNQVVKPTDHIFLLGDIAFSKVSYWFNRIKELPGYKHLICGNHDHNREKWYHKYMNTVVKFGDLLYLKLDIASDELSETPIVHYGNLLLSHVPAFESVGTAYDKRFQGLMRKGERWFYRGSCILNLHGHTHGNGAEKHNTFDVGVDVIGEQPIRLSQILNLKFPSIGLPKVVL